MKRETGLISQGGKIDDHIGEMLVKGDAMKNLNDWLSLLCEFGGRSFLTTERASFLYM